MLKFLETLLRLIVYTIAYITGRRSAEWDATKAALEESNRAVTEAEKTREKYLNLKRNARNVWE